MTLPRCPKCGRVVRFADVDNCPFKYCPPSPDLHASDPPEEVLHESE